MIDPCLDGAASNCAHDEGSISLAISSTTGSGCSINSLPNHGLDNPSENEMKQLLACYLSGQVSARQWEEHLKDPLFRLWIERKYREQA